VTDDATSTGLRVNRIEALTDGVFAIAMTILVLELHLPTGSESLWARLGHLWPQLASYVLSFVMLGVLWIGHHYQLHHIRRTDRPLIWLNLGFLLAITLLPFGTAVLGEELGDPAATTIYAGTIILGGVTLLAHWSYATRHPELLAGPIDPAIVSTLRIRIVFGIGVALTAIVVGYIDARASLAVLLGLPFVYLVRSRIDPKIAAR